MKTTKTAVVLSMVMALLSTSLIAEECCGGKGASKGQKQNGAKSHKMEKREITGNIISLADLQEAVFELLNDTTSNKKEIKELKEYVYNGNMVMTPGSNSSQKTTQSTSVADAMAGSGSDSSVSEFSVDDYDKYIIAYNKANEKTLVSTMKK